MLMRDAVRVVVANRGSGPEDPVQEIAKVAAVVLFEPAELAGHEILFEGSDHGLDERGPMEARLFPVSDSEFAEGGCWPELAAP